MPAAIALSCHADDIACEKRLRAWCCVLATRCACCSTAQQMPAAFVRDSIGTMRA
jgi:hypothetical protein